MTPDGARSKSIRLRLVGGLAHLLAGAAALCLGFMMLITVADVVVRAIRPEWRILGMLDHVEFSLDWLIWLSIALAFVERRHVVVDLVDSVVGARALRRIRGFAVVLSLVAFGLLASQVVAPALDTLEWGERTLDLGIPKFHYWLAIWVGVIASIVAILLTAIDEVQP